MREAQTGTAVVLLVFTARSLVAIVGNLWQLSARRRPPVPASASPSAPAVPPGTPSNLGATPDAFFVTHHGSDTGYHFTDKLTPDGVLAGYRHDDFAPDFTQVYGTRVSPALVERVFTCIRSPEYAALPNQIADPWICDGHVLKLTARIAGHDRVIWLSNTTHPLLTPLVEAVHAARPASPTAPSA